MEKKLVRGRLALVFNWTVQLPSEERQLFRALETLLEVLESFLWRSWPRGHQELRSLAQEGVKRMELSLILCGKKRIRRLNRDYRGKDQVTDVLSFPIHSTLRVGDDEEGGAEGAAASFLGGPCLLLGDVVISCELVSAQAKEFGLSWREEFLHLVVHGFLHLCGYDHELSPAEEQRMEFWEEKIIKKTFKNL